MKIAVFCSLAIVGTLSAADRCGAAEPAAPPKNASGFSWTAPPQRGPGGRVLGSAKAPLVPLPDDAKAVLTLRLPADPQSQLSFRYEFGLSGNNPPRFLVDSFTFKNGVAELNFHRASPDPGPPATPIHFSQGFSLGRPSPGDYRLRVVQSKKLVLERKWRIVDGAAK